MCRYNVVMSDTPRPKANIGGRPRVDSEAVSLRIRRPQLAKLDAWIAEQPKPRPSRPEAIRRLLEALLGAQTTRPTLDEQIERQQRRITSNAPAADISPANGMATLRRGLAETKLRGLKATKKTSRGSKR